MQSKNKFYLERAVGISVFSALAFIIALVFNIIPPVAGFLSLDAKDAVISICTQRLLVSLSLLCVSFLCHVEHDRCRDED